MVYSLPRIRLLFLLAVSVSPDFPAAASDGVDDRALGHDHFYNLEYEASIEANRRLVAQKPDDPVAHNRLATAILYKELLRLGKLETKAFKGDNQFHAWEKPSADPKVWKEFKGILLRGRQVAEDILEADSRDVQALYALSTNYGLESTYQFMLRTAYFGALHSSNRADKHSRESIKTHPEFIDGYLIAGTHEYVVGSLPWAVRYMVAVGGVRGSKKKGEEYVRLVAENGDLARDSARALLVLLLRREQRPLEAVPVLEDIIRDFPRNYLMHLELAGLYENAGQDDKALDIFRHIQVKVKTNTDRFDRMPTRVQEALARRIAEVERKMGVRSGGS